MALSGNVGASLLRLNSAACAPSLNEEILRSTPSAVSPSMMSQPVRKASAPRLAAPRRKPRRAGSGISLAASLISSLGSTPGMILRWRMMILFPTTMARRLFGTSSASATCTTKNPTIALMAKKCT